MAKLPGKVSNAKLETKWFKIINLLFAVFFNIFVLGCGKHAEQVMKDVPEAEKCVCPRA